MTEFTCGCCGHTYQTENGYDVYHCEQCNIPMCFRCYYDLKEICYDCWPILTPNENMVN